MERSSHRAQKKPGGPGPNSGGPSEVGCPGGARGVRRGLVL